MEIIGTGIILASAWYLSLNICRMNKFRVKEMIDSHYRILYYEKITNFACTYLPKYILK
jgi:hypothetical protein